MVTATFSADGKLLMSDSRDKKVRLWRVNIKQKIATLSGRVDSVPVVAVSPVAQLIARGSRDKTIKIW
ncbi:hypothetical protein BZZ01_01385 [Nostocales cyanobacterium HT-58-2]|nr:hypothetical protein BZZ01_01385 [Nostocales cyanobacterium HT-58-2]